MTAMKFETRTLRDALNWIVNHVDVAPTTPADAALLVSPPKDGHVVLAGGCNQSVARVRIPYLGDEFTDEVAIHAHTLATIVKSAPGTDITLTLKDSGVLIKSGAAKSKVMYLSSQDVSAARGATTSPRQGSIPASTLIDVVAGLSSIPNDKDFAYPETAGVKFQYADGVLALAATDRFIVGATKVPLNVPEENPNAEGLTLNALVPNSILQAIVRTIPTEGDVWLHWDHTESDSRLAMSTDNYWVSFMLSAANSKFPAYQQLLNSVKGETTIEVDRKALSATLTRANHALGKEANAVGLISHTEDEMAGEVTIKGTGTFDHEEELTARVAGETVDPALMNAHYLAQTIKAARGENITLTIDARLVKITSDHTMDTQYVIPRLKTAKI